jgi:hypothetical protein
LNVDVKMLRANAMDANILVQLKNVGDTMKTIEVQCAICKFVTVIELRWDHRKGPGSEPDVWICDTHR